MTTHVKRPLENVAVVIPCYRSANSVGTVIEAIPREIPWVICVDDASDDDLGEVLRGIASKDHRLIILTHQQNCGVGAATVSGYRRAIEEGARAIVKIDSDGQMNPDFILAMVTPIFEGEADYVKGNRFFDVDRVRQMPSIRLIGNAGLTFFSRISSGYWNLSDPTNGFTAIDAGVAAILPLHKLHPRYFFESDILFRLNSFGAVIREQPIESRYGDEVSNLGVLSCLVTFPFLHLRNFWKRLFYNYFLRNFDLASLYLLAGAALLIFGAVFGAAAWRDSAMSGVPATTGTVMLSVLPLILGFQLLLSFLHHDLERTPKLPIRSRISSRQVLLSQESKT